jgi:hypothetical protein
MLLNNFEAYLKFMHVYKGHRGFLAEAKEAYLAVKAAELNLTHIIWEGEALNVIQQLQNCH